MCPLCFPVIPWRLGVLPTKTQFRAPIISQLPSFFLSFLSKLMWDIMSSVKIISIPIRSHSEDGKGIRCCQRVVTGCFCGSGQLLLPCPNGNSWFCLLTQTENKFCRNWDILTPSSHKFLSSLYTIWVNKEMCKVLHDSSIDGTGVHWSKTWGPLAFLWDPPWVNPPWCQEMLRTWPAAGYLSG